MRLKTTLTILATTLTLSLALSQGRTASADSTASLSSLAEVIGFWEQQKAKANPPQPANCDDLRRMLARAEAELAAEKKAYEESLKHPPTSENANGGIAAGWARNRNAEAKRIREAEKQLKALRRRIAALCPDANAGGGATDQGGGKPDDGKKDDGKKPEGKPDDKQGEGPKDGHKDEGKQDGKGATPDEKQPDGVKQDGAGNEPGGPAHGGKKAPGGKKPGGKKGGAPNGGAGAGGGVKPPKVGCVLLYSEGPFRTTAEANAFAARAGSGSGSVNGVKGHFVATTRVPTLPPRGGQVRYAIYVDVWWCPD